MFSGKSKRSKIAKVYCMNVSWKNIGILSGQISHSVVSNSLRPHEPQHTRPPCPSPTPGVHSDSHPSSPWCHPAISSSVVPFSSCPQIPPSIRVFSNESTLRMRWPKYWSFSFSILYRVPIISIMGEVGDHFLCLPGMNIPYTFNFNPHSCSEGTVIRLRAGWWHVRII